MHDFFSHICAVTKYLIFSISGYLSNRKDGAGQICPSMLFDNLIFFVMSRFKNCKSNFFFKKSSGWAKIKKKLRIHYSEMKFFILKTSARITPRHIRCFDFFFQDQYGNRLKVNESRYVLVKQNLKKFGTSGLFFFKILNLQGD